MINKRHPEVGHIILENLSRESVPCLAAVKRIDGQLRRHMELPTWEEVAEGTQAQEDESVELGLSRHGWQKTAHMCFEKKHFDERVWPALNNTDRAMSRSQRGPLTPPSSSHSFVFEILQVWPPTRPTWPPPRGMLRSRSFVETWFPTGKGSSTSVP